MTDWQPWESAWRRALYGERGFYLRPEGPAGHFRTASHAAPGQLAAAIRHLAREHDCTKIIDVGAGRGELLRALAYRRPGPHSATSPSATPARATPARATPAGTTSPHATPTGTTSARATPGRLELHGVDVVARPVELPPEIGWSEGILAIGKDAFQDALVIGWELLDVVPCAVLEVDADGVAREVCVDAVTGRERLGETVNDPWIQRWWADDQLAEGDRIEVGSTRDALWAELNRRAGAGGARLSVAVDYAHVLETRPPAGSLTGFRQGRAVPPRPDGSMDITAHVAIDSVAAAVDAALARTGSTTITTQSRALRDLRVTDRELLDDGGLGGFAWLTTLLS